MTQPQQQPQRDPSQMNSFQQFVGQVEDGQLHADLTQAMNRLVADMQNHLINVGGTPKGKIAITFDFKLEGGVIEVAGNYSVTAPKRVGGRSIFWVTPDNNLTGRNPKQMDMLRDVGGAAQPMRAV